MSRIFFDTNLLVYLVEDYKDLSDRVIHIVTRMRERRDELVTSTLTLGELLVKPLSAGDSELAARYEELIGSPGVTLIPFDHACARSYAEIRQDRGIRPADAVQLACAATTGCDLFITNDERLSRKVVRGIQFITSLKRAFL